MTPSSMTPHVLVWWQAAHGLPMSTQQIVTATARVAVGGQRYVGPQTNHVAWQIGDKSSCVDCGGGGGWMSQCLASSEHTLNADKGGF